jgi:hypothetical protein
VGTRYDARVNRYCSWKRAILGNASESTLTACACAVNSIPDAESELGGLRAYPANYELRMDSLGQGKSVRADRLRPKDFSIQSCSSFDPFSEKEAQPLDLV